jgi:hypothetical protein
VGGLGGEGMGIGARTGAVEGVDAVVEVLLPTPLPDGTSTYLLSSAETMPPHSSTICIRPPMFGVLSL